MVNVSNTAAYYLPIAEKGIGNGNFAGDDIRYDEAFEALEAELAKKNSLYNQAAVDWLKVRETCDRLLRQRTKDLRLAIWLTWSLHETRALPGLVQGLALLRALCEKHWSILHPLKARTRAGSFSWLAQRLDEAVTATTSLKDQLPTLKALLDHLDHLDACLTGHLNDEAPLLLPVRRRFAGLLVRAQEVPAPGQLATIVAQAKQTAAQMLGVEPPIEDEKEAQRSFRAVQAAVRRLTTWWLRQDAAHTQALALNRALVWAGIQQLPERNAERITTLRCLAKDVQASYRERFEEGTRFADLLVDVEASLCSAPFWLDGQRLAWECLEQLGAQPAMNILEAQLRGLLQRLPGLTNLCFHDGQPFADQTTLIWIDRHVDPPAPQPTLSSETLARTPPWEAVLSLALERLPHDGLKGAVQAFKPQMQGACDSRERFHWQMALSKLCYRAKRFDLAMTQLEALDTQLHETCLDRWEPGLALEVLQLLHACCEAMPQNNAVRERKDEVFKRLCRLDIEAALE